MVGLAATLASPSAITLHARTPHDQCPRTTGYLCGATKLLNLIFSLRNPDVICLRQYHVIRICRVSDVITSDVCRAMDEVEEAVIGDFVSVEAIEVHTGGGGGGGKYHTRMLYRKRRRRAL